MALPFDTTAGSSFGGPRIKIPANVSGTVRFGGPAGSSSPYSSSPYGGGFPDPFSGNIFAGIPTQISQTPYGAMLAQAKQYLYTPQQLSNIASQQAQAQTKAALDASYANQTAEQATFAAMQNRAAGLAQALGNFGPGYASAIQDIYDKAAQTQAAVGPGVVQQGVGDMNTQLAAAQQQVADKTGGQGQVSSYDPNALGATLQTTGVEMPGNALATSGANAAQMALYGAMADKAQVGAIGQYYQQQAIDALNQRTAERAQIIAQQPALYQQALEAQRQDNYQTQARIDNIINQGQSWIAQRMGLRLQSAQAQSDWAFKVAGFTHQNPYTGQAQNGYIPIKLADGSTTIVSYADAAKAAHWSAQGVHWTNQDINNLNRINTLAGNKNTIGTYSPSLSQQAGILVDGHGRHFKDANGNDITYTPTKTAAASTYSDSLSKQRGFLYDSNNQPILDASGNQIPYSAKKGSKSYAYNEGLSKQRGFLYDSNNQPILDASGNKIPYSAKKASTAGQLTPKDVQKYTADINAGLQFMSTGKDGKGRTINPATGKPYDKITDRASAMTELQNAGYFTNPTLAAIAMKALNKYYPVSKKILDSGPFHLPIVG